MKKLTYKYENLPSFIFEMKLDDDADIDYIVKENEIVIVSVENCESEVFHYGKKK